MYPRCSRKSSLIKRYFAEHRLVSIIAAHLVVLSIFAGALFSGAFGGAFAQSPCSSGDQVYKVVSGDTLGAVATRYNTTWQSLASYNKLANANVLAVNQTICIPGKSAATNSGKTTTTFGASMNVPHAMINPFPYAQCTWFANERYHQLTGLYVPWTTNANAWQWVARAQQYNWTVSSSPSVGSIIVLQPWTEGAYGLGHVGVVENILSNGRVVASSMNWAGNGANVTDAEFTAGPGVSFITA